MMACSGRMMGGVLNSVGVRRVVCRRTNANTRRSLFVVIGGNDDDIERGAAGGVSTVAAAIAATA